MSVSNREWARTLQPAPERQGRRDGRFMNLIRALRAGAAIVAALLASIACGGGQPSDTASSAPTVSRFCKYHRDAGQKCAILPAA